MSDIFCFKTLPRDKVLLTLKKIYEFNVKRFQGGRMGAVNGMRPDGQVDESSIQFVSSSIL